MHSNVMLSVVHARISGYRLAIQTACVSVATSLILYRVMRQSLSAAETGLSPERALDQLRRIQQHQVRINKQSNPISGISKLSDLHHRVFAALELKNPTQPQQLSLL